MKVWIITEHDRDEGGEISFILSVWGNRQDAEAEFDKLRAQDHFGVSYWIDEWEVQNK